MRRTFTLLMAAIWLVPCHVALATVEAANVVSSPSTDQDALSAESDEVDVDPPETPDEQDEWRHVEPTESDPPPEEPIEHPLTSDQIALRHRLRQCLAYYFHRPETTHRRSPWGVMHAVIGFGVDTPLTAGDRQVNAIAWLCANAPCYGMRLLYDRNSSPRVRMGPGYQGHGGQFLCVLAQSRVKIDYPLVVGGRRMAVADLVRHEQLTCRAGTELTFKLIGLAHYLDPDTSWLSDNGKKWDIERLLQEELAQPIVGAACGGTHRLTGYSYAVRKRERTGKPMTGQWSRAKAYLEDYHEYTFKLQNADGSLSTNWFAKRGTSGDLNRRLNTTGHTLEWLVFSLPEHQLDDPRVVGAVSYLTDLMWQYRGHDWHIGAKGHAIHALVLYDERRFGGTPGHRAVELAQQPRDTAAADIDDSIVSEESPRPMSPSLVHPPGERSAGATRNGVTRRRRRFR